MWAEHTSYQSASKPRTDISSLEGYKGNDKKKSKGKKTLREQKIQEE